MSQQQWLTLCFKIVLVADVAAIAAWISTYSRLAPWWRNPVGRSLVLKPALLALALIPAIVRTFFKLSPQQAQTAGWADVAIFTLIAVVMAWRSVIWVRLHRASRLPSAMEARIAECEAEVASLRARLAECSLPAASRTEPPGRRVARGGPGPAVRGSPDAVPGLTRTGGRRWRLTT